MLFIHIGALHCGTSLDTWFLSKHQIYRCYVFESRHGGCRPLQGSGPRREALEPDERALGLPKRLGRLLRRDDPTYLVVVPRRSGLAWRLHLRQEKIVQ